MKKYLSLFILITLIISLNSIWGQTGPQNDSSLISYSYHFEEPIIKNIILYNSTYQRVFLQDCELYSKVGTPRLPIKPLRILLPKDTIIISIKVNTDELIDLNYNVSNIELGEPGYPLSTNENRMLPPNPCYYKSTSFPDSSYNLIGVQQSRGYSILHINLHPVQYLDEMHSISYYSNMTLEIEVKGGIQHPLFRGIEKDEQRILNNIENIDPLIMSTYNQFHSKLINQGPFTYNYIIITTEDFKNYHGTYDLYDLTEKREEQGLTTLIKTVEEIYDEYAGRDKQEQIRNFIKDAYLNFQTDWILLAGDVEFVPVRYLWDIDGADIGMASDIYYQCLDGDYNSDNDSWYGERNDGVNSDIIDLYAEVFIGRASVDNTDQIENFVKKTLAYEAYEWGVTPHLEKAESVGEYVWSGSGGWGAGYVERCIDYCGEYGHDTHGISSNVYKVQPLYERDIQYSEIDLIQDINNGVNFINHLGHSSPTYCMRFTPDDIFNFTNTYYSFWYSQGCHPGQFHMADECISEAWTVYSNGGFAAIMNTGYGYGSNDNYDGSDNRFAREFWDALNNSAEKISRLGPANQDSKEDNMWHIDDGNQMYHNCYSTSLFGDPYVQIKGMEDFRADFTWTPIYPTPNCVVSFVDESLAAESFYWDFDDGETSTKETPDHIFSDEGIYNVTLMIQGMDNQEDGITRSVQIFENWPPIAIPIPKKIATDSTTIQFQAENSWDPDGEVVEYHWDFDDGVTSDKISPSHTFNLDGIYMVKLTVTDDKGKQGYTLCDIRIDQNTPPISEVIIGGERGENNWLISPAHISLQSSDWSGVKRIKYRIDNGDWYSYKNPVIVDSNGGHVIEYYGEDIWGNVEEIQSESFSIDTQIPELLVSLNGTKNKGWYTSPVTITCQGNDNGSGLQNIYYMIVGKHDDWQIYSNPINLHKDGKNDLLVYVKDYAGLTYGKDIKYTINIDQLSPVTTSFFSGDPSPGKTINIKLDAYDEGIGVKDIWYQLDEQSLKKYNDEITLSDEGSHLISYYSLDYLGNQEETQEQYFMMGVEPTIDIYSPTPGIYVDNNQIFSLNGKIFAVGNLEIKASCSPNYLTKEKINIYVDEIPKNSIDEFPIIWVWDEISFGNHMIKVEVEFIDIIIEKEIKIFKIF